VTFITVPLRARGHAIGAMALGSTKSGRHYTFADVPLAEELGRRAAMAVDNARLYREARAAVAAREDLVSIASHDLKTPLAAIKLRVQRLTRAGRDAVELDEELAVIERQVDRMAQLVDSFLQISRVAAGFLDLRLERLDASVLVSEVVARYADQLREAGCTITVDAPQPVVGMWDRARMDQVATNLISNALKFGRGRPIEVSVSTVDHHLRLVVRDFGPGIAGGEQEKIFERFRRATGGVPGFGLGLWIVRRIVEAHGGSIHVTSQLGAGARFTVELPLENTKNENSLQDKFTE
jgi:signal transduction histidine kinase